MKDDIIYEYLKKECLVFFEASNETLGMITFSNIINTVNPYFLLATNRTTASDIIKSLIDSYILLNEKIHFDNLLKGLAIFINGKVFSGRKSGIKGIDLEFDKDGIRYIVSIKSGPNWGNSSQIEKMINNFNTAKKTLRTGNSHLQIVCVNGCCYGKTDNYDKGAYFKYCGQRFWEFIGGSESIYTDIIEPLGYKARERNEDYLEKYSQMINRFTKEFMELFCDISGKIDWNKLVRFNSAKNTV
jgi:hypothetical protein